MLPARIKTSTNYQAARLARIEGRSHGYAEHDHAQQIRSMSPIQAALACCWSRTERFSHRPRAKERSRVSRSISSRNSAKEQHIPFEGRSIDRTDLYIADEIALAGTLAEVVPVLSVDGNECTRKTRLLATLGERYFAAARGIQPHPALDLSVRRYAPPTDAVGAEAASAQGTDR